MDRMEILDEVESLFDKAGFNLSQRCCARRSCFDFAVRKEKQVAFVKVQPNIGHVCKKDADGLKTLAKVFSAASMFICEKTRDKPLEDDTIYSRYHVGSATLKTVEDVLLRGMGPLVEAGPGGCYVRLNGDVIRKQRLNMGLSIGEMAETIGVSRRTLYGYERGIAKASVSTAYKLEWVLGAPVAQPIDIFLYPEKTEGFLATAKRIISENRFLQLVIKKLLQFDFTVFQLRRAPFDFVAKTPESKTSLLGAVASENERNLEARTKEIMSVSKIVEAHPIFVTECKEASTNNVPFIYREDLEKIKCSDDLMTRL